MKFNIGGKSTEVEPESLRGMPVDSAISYLNGAAAELTRPARTQTEMDSNINHLPLQLALQDFMDVGADMLDVHAGPATISRKLDIPATRLIKAATEAGVDLADKTNPISEITSFVVRGTSAMLMGHGSTVKTEPEPVTRILKTLNSQYKPS